MSMELKRAVGKFIYPQGSETLLHFMELKSFHVEESLDFAQLFYLRALRRHSAESVGHYESVLQWLSRSSIKVLTEAIATILDSKAAIAGQVKVVEAHPGIGVLFEFLKYLLESSKLDPDISSLSYIAAVREDDRHRFAVLHADDSIGLPDKRRITITPFDSLQQSSESPTLAIFNVQYCLRHGQAYTFQAALEWLQSWSPAHGLIALDAFLDQSPRTVTTIAGEHIRLTNLREVAACLLPRPLQTFYRFIPDFDADYFLPETTPGTLPGLLLIYLPIRETTSAPNGFTLLKRK